MLEVCVRVRSRFAIKMRMRLRMNDICEHSVLFIHYFNYHNARYVCVCMRGNLSASVLQ